MINHLKSASNNGQTLELSANTSYLPFQIGEQSYAANVLSVVHVLSFRQEIIKNHEDSVIYGTVDYLGEQVRLFELRKLLGQSTPEYRRNTIIVILEAGSERFGVIADTVSSLVHIVNPVKAEQAPAWVQGKGSFGSQEILVLNAQELLNTVITQRTPVLV